MHKGAPIIRLAAVAAASLVAMAAFSNGPHLTLDSTYVDLGVISGDTVAVGRMGFQNTGDEPLTIMRVYSECGCTVPHFPAEPIEPGESGVIVIQFDGRNRTNGHFRKALRVRSNADNERQSFIIKGTILRPGHDAAH